MEGEMTWNVLVFANSSWRAAVPLLGDSHSLSITSWRGKPVRGEELTETAKEALSREPPAPLCTSASAFTAEPWGVFANTHVWHG